MVIYLYAVQHLCTHYLKALCYSIHLTRKKALIQHELGWKPAN